MSHSPTETVAEQFREYTESAWNEGEFERLDELFAEDVVVHNVATDEEYDGREAVKEWVRGVRQGFPDFEVKMTETSFIVGEEDVASRWTVRGTHEGRLPEVDVEPTSKAVEFSGTTVYRLNDAGEVAEAWWYYDNLAFLTQLGLVPEGVTP